MRLLVVSQYFWPESFKINDLVRELVVRGHEVTVLTGTPTYPDRDVFAAYESAPEKFNSYCGADIVRVPLTARGSGLRLILNYLSFALSAAILGPVKLRAKDFDGIFVFEPSPVTVGIPGIVLRRLRGVPLVFWVQDLWPDTLQAIGAVKSPRLLSMVGHLVRYIYNRCDLILAQSRSFIPRIACYSDHPDRIRYFPNWAEPLYETVDAVPAPEVEPAQGRFTVMFAGNIGDAQNFPSILAAAERLRDRADIRWVIVGDGRLSDWVAGEIATRDLARSVTMVGRFPMERMPSFFLCADALLVSLKPDPALSATIPAKLQTYLAAGVPVLAMIDGEGAEIVKGSGAGLVCAAGDSAGLAAAVAQMSAMSVADRRQMGRRGRDITAAEFDRKAQIDKLDAWLQELQVGAPGARTAS